MSMPRFSAKRDANEQEIVDAARQLGWWLTKLDTPCDWLGAFRGVWFPIEIKGEHGTLTAAQKKFHREAYQRGASVLTWVDVDDVMIDSKARQSA